MPEIIDHFYPALHCLATEYTLQCKAQINCALDLFEDHALVADHEHTFTPIAFP